jgi:hypothetical protein
MKTKIIEVTQGSEFNWGKFLVGEFEEEWQRGTELPGVPQVGSLLLARGWTQRHILVLDLETGEGAIFFKFSTSASADLHKHRIWVCPMYEPFLEWLLAQKFQSIDDLPEFVKLDTEYSAMAGYRREGK